MAEHSQDNPNERLELFTDAVIAITITLLVLEIQLPEGAGEMNDRELWAALLGLRERFLAYLISFAVIGVYWLNHHGKFSRIVGSSRPLLLINLLFLLFIGLVPFTTALIAENGGATSTIIYASGMVCCGLPLMWMWIHADRTGLIDPLVDQSERQKLMRSTLLSSVVFVLSLPIALLDADWAKWFWLLIIPANGTARVIAPKAKQ